MTDSIHNSSTVSAPQIRLVRQLRALQVFVIHSFIHSFNSRSSYGKFSIESQFYAEKYLGKKCVVTALVDTRNPVQCYVGFFCHFYYITYNDMLSECFIELYILCTSCVY